MNLSWLYILIIFCSPEKLIEIPITSGKEIPKISKEVSIIDASSSYIRAIANEEGIKRLQNLGYKVEIIIQDYTEYSKKFLKLEGYHTYEEVINEMINVATNYPDITFLDTLGYSVEGRLILGLKISDNPSIHENEAGIRFTGCHHGNEHISKEILLYMIHWITENYAKNQYIKSLVDTREIWFIPMVNPDGVYHSTRVNANGVDLNRDYGYMWEGAGGSPAPFSQPETRAIRKNMLENRFVLEFDYHSPVEIVNTLWDYTKIYPQDDTIIMDIGREYADSTGYLLIRGWYWYEVHGCCQDAVYGCEGILGYTIETLEPDTPLIVCEKNRGAILSMIKRAGDRGIKGIVTDSLNNTPLDARIVIKEIRWPIYTDPRLGDYHRVLLPGKYTVEVFGIGYKPKTIHNVIVSDSVTTLNITLSPEGKFYAHRIVWALIADPENTYSNLTLTPDALGPPDSLFLSLGEKGEIVLDMGIGSFINTLTVYEGNDGNPNEGYVVLVSRNWDGPFDTIGVSYGTSELYVGREMRYVKIIDTGNNVRDTLYPGFDLDAIEVCPVKVEEEVKINSLYLYQNFPNPFKQTTQIKYSLRVTQYISLKIYDVVGRIVEKLVESKVTPGDYSIQWYRKDLPSGIYFIELKAGETKFTRKIILIQ